MENRKLKNKSSKPKTELYLKIPYHILNLPALELSEKILPAQEQTGTGFAITYS